MNFQQQIAQSLIWRGLYFVTILVMNIFVSRYFEAGNSGWIFYLCNNFSFLLILVGLTIENGVNYYASKKEIDDRQLTWFAIAWSVMVALVVFVGLWFYFGRYRDTTVITRYQYLYYAVCYIAGIQLTNIFTVLFYTRKNFFLPNFLMVLLNIIFILIIPKQQGLEDTNPSIFIKLYFGYFMLTGLVLTIAYIIKTKSVETFSLPSFTSLKLLIRYALMALAANVIFFLVYRVDYWFVNRFCSPEELGNYIQVSKLGQMLLIIPTIISSVVFPHTAGGMQLSQMKDNILRIGRFTTVLYLILFIVVLLIGRDLFPWTFGNSFRLMYTPFLLLVPGIWALSNLFILSAYFGGVNKVKVNIQGACIGLVMILIGDFLFIPKYGMYAAAIVSTIGYIATFLYSFLHISKEHSVSITQYWSINKDDIKWLQAIIKR
jgi:O-antigen/teichoic acid export membrane protein